MTHTMTRTMMRTRRTTQRSLRCSPRACHRLGQAQPIAIGGEEVLGILPVFPNLIPQVLCVSYADKMYMTLTADRDAIKQPEKLAECYLDELKTLAATHGVDPRDESEPIEGEDALLVHRPVGGPSASSGALTEMV